MLNPVEKKDIGECYHLQTADKIVEKIKYDIAIEREEIMEVDSEAEVNMDSEAEDKLTDLEVSRLCQQLECLCLHFGKPDSSLDLNYHLQQFQIHLRREETVKLK